MLGVGVIEAVMTSKGKSQLGRLNLFCSIWALSNDLMMLPEYVMWNCHTDLTVTATGFSCILR